jgi:3-oxoacyl-[acyl-carrier protein] reductase
MTASHLQGKSAWVTGSSRGIGRAIAVALAGAGCNVAIHGHNQSNLRTSGEGDSLDSVAAEMSRRSGSRVIAVCGELTRPEEVRRCAEEIRAAFGGIDILVCNAGGSNLTGELDFGGIADGAADFAPESLAKVNHNLLPTLFCCRECAPEMRRHGAGRIITIGSIAACGGSKTGGRHHVPYAVGKAAVQEYSRLLAAQLRHDNIPVNCIIPGNIDSPSTRLRFRGGRENPREGLSRLEQLGKPEDNAALALFLCGPGGEYISGQLIRVDGGEQTWPC